MGNDFSNCIINNRQYGGTEKKIGININGCAYMIKFQKNTPFGMRFNHISEYLGSHIFQLLGINAHQTFLGVYNNQNVVACKDFVEDGYLFVPFNDIGESTIEENRDRYQYTYSDIIEILEKNKKLTAVEETISSFFDIYVVDALLGNFDRHGANWGFLKKNNKYQLAPVFDNGACLFPQMIDENEMRYIINNEEEINKRIYTFPTSQIKLHGRKSSYFEVLSSLKFEECNKSLVKIYQRIDLNEIFKLIDDIDSISEIHKEFYKVMVEQRFKKIIEYSYFKLKGKNNE